MISRKPDAAVYRQIAAALREQIQSGVLSPGAMLPSEPRLGQTYGVARETIRRALRELKTEGLIVVIPGRGTWVREPQEPRTVSMKRGTNFQVRMPTPDEVSELALDQGVPVVVISNGSESRIIPTSGTTFMVR